MKILILLLLINVSFASSTKEENKTFEKPFPENKPLPDNEEDPSLKQSKEDEKYNRNGNPPSWTPEERRFNKNGPSDGGLF